MLFDFFYEIDPPFRPLVDGDLIPVQPPDLGGSVLIAEVVVVDGRRFVVAYGDVVGFAPIVMAGPRTLIVWRKADLGNEVAARYVGRVFASIEAARAELDPLEAE